jgi:hypothetical protein
MISNVHATILRRGQITDGGPSYVLGCIAGASAVQDNTIPRRKSLQLVTLNPVHIVREPIAEGFADWEWIGGIIVWSAYLTQIMATLMLSFRRMMIVDIRESPADVHSLICAIGGFIVGMQALMIQFNRGWRIRPEAVQVDMQQFRYWQTAIVVWGAAFLDCILSMSMIDMSKHLSSLIGCLVCYGTSWVAVSVMMWYRREVGGALLITHLIIIAGASVLWPAVDIKLMHDEFNSNTTTSWRWKDPLSDKLWVV